jgi:hypothetical protein
MVALGWILEVEILASIGLFRSVEIEILQAGAAERPEYT